MSLELTDKERLDFFYEPCKSKEELRLFMQGFLNIDLPDQIIDENSTSSPLNFIWSVYKVMLTGQGPTTHIVASSRGSTKTLSASLIRLFGLLHFRRDGTHLAATEDQSKSANIYLDRWLKLPEVAPFVSQSNTKTRELINLPANSYTKKSKAILRVAVATMSGVNSQRGSLNTRDEVDLLPSTILDEASFIREPTQDEHQYEPIELNLSSRKTSSGPIQTMLDQAEKTPSPHVQVHKWSLVDWMRKCTPETHKPELPRVPAYVNVETLKIVFDKENFDAMDSAQQALQKQILAYEGCRTCPAFIVCQARSPAQEGTSRHLRSIDFMAGMIRDIKSADKMIAQGLNWRAESSSIVFRVFNRKRHFLSAVNSWKWLFGDYFNPQKFHEEDILRAFDSGKLAEISRFTPTKKQIYNKLIRDGWTVHYGVDWGYFPDPAYCIVIAYHKKQKRAFILHGEGANYFDNQAWAEYVFKNIYSVFPCELTCPDLADKPSPTYFRKYGMTARETKPSRIMTGVSQIRGLLWNVGEQVEKMAILDDGEMGQNKVIAEAFEKWTHHKTPMGYDYNKFDEDSEFTHPLDSARYALDPLIDTQTIKMRITQPKTQNELIVAAHKGDKDAEAALQASAHLETKAAIERHFLEEHGLKDVFKAEQKLREQARAKEDIVDEINDPPPPKKTGLKYRF